MATISVASQQSRQFRDSFAAWRREDDVRIFAEPPESAGTKGAVNFSCVPEEFLQVLGAAGFQYTKISFK